TDLCNHVVDDGACNVQARRRFDPFEARRGIDLHDLRAVLGFELVDAGDAQPHDLRGANGCLVIRLVELDDLGLAAAMHVASKLLALGHAPHGRHLTVTDHDRTNVFALAFGDELLNQHVLTGALQGFDDGFGDLDAVGQDHAYALSAFEQFDDDGCASDSFYRGEHVALAAHEGRLRNAHLVATQDLQRAQLVP